MPKKRKQAKVHGYDNGLRTVFDGWPVTLEEYKRLEPTLTHPLSLDPPFGTSHQYLMTQSRTKETKHDYAGVSA